MVKTYALDGSSCDSYYGCSSKMTECDTGGDYVLATDYAALEADRDEWKRRCGGVMAVCQEMYDMPTSAWNNLWDRPGDVLLRCAIAITEGRDNG